MAILSNVNGKFAVDSTGAIQFSGQTGTSGYVLKSNGNAAPTWVDGSTVIGGPYLPLAGGTLTGATSTASGISFTVGGTLTVNGSGGSVFNSTAASNHIIAAYRATNGNNVATFRTTDLGYIFRIHAQNAGTIYVQNDDGSNYLKIADSGSNEVSGNTTFTGNLNIGPDALDIQIKAASNNSGNNLIYMRGNASNDKSSLQMNHFGYADYYIGVGHVGNGKFNIANNLTGNDFVIDTSGNVGIGTASPDVSGAGSSSTVLSVIETVGNRRGILELGDNQNADTGGIGSINFVGTYQDAGHKIMAEIRASGSGATSGQRGSYISMFTKANGTAAIAERMRIESSGATSFAGSASLSSAVASIQHLSSNGYLYIKGGTGGLVIGDDSTASRIQIEDNSNIRFETAGTERMRIESGGNLRVNFNQSGSYGNLYFQDVDNGASMFYLQPAVYKGSAPYNTNYINAANSSNIGFIAGGSERMRITSVGNVEISSGGSLYLKNTSGNNWNILSYTNGNLFLQQDGTSNLGVFDGTSGAYTALSDVNKKKDFEDSKIGLKEVMELQPKLYRMKEDDADINKRLGFIAQEVKEFIPQACVENEVDDVNKFIGLTEMPIIAALVKSIQELEARVKELENK